MQNGDRKDKNVYVVELIGNGWILWALIQALPNIQYNIKDKTTDLSEVDLNKKLLSVANNNYYFYLLIFFTKKQ